MAGRVEQPSRTSCARPVWSRVSSVGSIFKLGATHLAGVSSMMASSDAPKNQD